MGRRVNGERMKELRKQRGFTQDTLSQATFLVKRTIERAEQGHSVNMSTIARIAQILNVPTEELLERNEVVDVPVPECRWIHPLDAARYHAAARMIEDDLEEAYFTCRQKYGADVAGVLLVFALRAGLNDRPGQWPPPDDLVQKVNERLVTVGLMSR